MKAPLEIPTERETIVVRELTFEDATAYFNAVDANRDHLSQFGDETAAKYPNLKSVEDSIANPTNPDKLRMGIWDGDTFVGSINLTPNKEAKAAEVGYWLDSRHIGNGYATVATRAIAGYARQRYNTVFANVTEGNEASVAVLRRAGFTQTARHAGKLAFELAKRLPDANYESAYSIDTIKSRDQFLTSEQVRQFRERYTPQYTQQRVDRAFGILIHPTSGGTALSRREIVRSHELGLIVSSREEAGLPPPSKDAQLSNINVVQVGSFLDFVENVMPTARLWGLTRDTERFLIHVANQLSSQLEETPQTSD